MNLLPSIHRKIIKNEIVLKFLVSLLLIFSFWGVLFAAAAYNTAFYLNIQREAIEERIAVELGTDEAGEVIIIEEEINSLNETLSDIDKINNLDSLNFPYILRIIGGITPAGVSLDSFSFSRGAINIKGHADFREQVIELENRIKSEQSFSNLISPLSNIVKEGDIDFNFTFSVKN